VEKYLTEMIEDLEKQMNYKGRDDNAHYKKVNN